MDHRTDDASGLPAPRRNHYFYSKLMGVLQFQMEQAYGIRERRLMNRLTLGVGVLCGLDVHARGSQICDKLKEVIERQQFEVAIQAAIGGKIIARSTVKAAAFISSMLPASL